MSEKPRAGLGDGFQEGAGHQSILLNGFAFTLYEYWKEVIGLAD